MSRINPLKDVSFYEISVLRFTLTLYVIGSAIVLSIPIITKLNACIVFSNARKRMFLSTNGYAPKY
jgi:hypothetical protein